MGKVIMQATVSVDGFIADVHDEPGPLFDWYRAGGAVAVDFGDEQRRFTVGPASAAYVEDAATHTGACVIGRRIFDLTNGWNGRPAAGDAVFVVTHQPPTDWPFPDAPFEFITAGVAEAIRRAQAVAGDRDVSVMAGDVGAQALHAGLIDELRLDLAPVLLGRGIPFFGTSHGSTRLLENPVVIDSNRVTHLIYELRHPRTPETDDDAGTGNETELGPP